MIQVATEPRIASIALREPLGCQTRLALPERSLSSLDTVHCIDALSLLRAQAAHSVDAIITDLPYGTTAASWDVIIPFAPLWEAVRHALKPRGVFVTTASQPFTSMLVMSNLKWFRYEWIWEKNIGGNFLNASNQPMKEHENLLIFCGATIGTYIAQRIERKDKTRAKYPYKAKTRGEHEVYGNYSFPMRVEDDINTRVPRSLLSFNRETGLHPTQKPVALYEYLILTYTQPNALVVDPCCGSGTTGVAARNTNRRYIIGDTSQEYVDIARKRLAQPYTVPMFE